MSDDTFQGLPKYVMPGGPDWQNSLRILGDPHQQAKDRCNYALIGAGSDHNTVLAS